MPKKKPTLSEVEVNLRVRLTELAAFESVIEGLTLKLAPVHNYSSHDGSYDSIMQAKLIFINKIREEKLKVWEQIGWLSTVSKPMADMQKTRLEKLMQEHVSLFSQHTSDRFIYDQVDESALYAEIRDLMYAAARFPKEELPERKVGDI